MIGTLMLILIAAKLEAISEKQCIFFMICAFIIWLCKVIQRMIGKEVT